MPEQQWMTEVGCEECARWEFMNLYCCLVENRWKNTSWELSQFSILLEIVMHDCTMKTGFLNSSAKFSITGLTCWVIWVHLCLFDYFEFLHFAALMRFHISTLRLWCKHECVSSVGQRWKQCKGASLACRANILLFSSVVLWYFLYLHTWEQNMTSSTPPGATNMKFQSYDLVRGLNADSL